MIHTYSGYENKVKTNLEHRIESMGVQDKIFQVVIPTEEEIEIKDGQRRTVQRRSSRATCWSRWPWTTTPGTSCATPRGHRLRRAPARDPRRSGRRSQEDPEADAARKPPKVKVSFTKGERVKVVDGPFTDFIGVVDDINPEKGKVRVLVSFFGRETPVELDFLQVADHERIGSRRQRRAGDPVRFLLVARFWGIVAKKVKAIITLQLPAGKATPAPPVGPALGQHGINMMEFSRNTTSAPPARSGMVIPALITIFEDRSFSFVTKTPPAADLIKKAAGIDKGSGDAGPRQGRHASRATKVARDRRDQDERPERQRHRGRDADDRRHRAQHGRGGQE